MVLQGDWFQDPLGIKICRCSSPLYSNSHISCLYSSISSCGYGGLPIYTREGNGNPLQYSYLENPMDGWAWWAAVHGVAKSWTRLSDFTVTFHFHALEKEMATHSSILAWRISGKGEPGGLPSMGSHRVRTRLKWLSSSSLYIPTHIN